MPLKIRRKNGEITDFVNSEYLPAYYFIPKEILDKCGQKLNSIPRNIRQVVSSWDATETVELNIRLSQSEMDKLTRNAQRSGLSKSNYIRMLVNGYVPKESPPIEYNQLIRAMTDVYSELKLQHTDEAAKELQTAILQLQAALTLPERRS